MFVFEQPFHPDASQAYSIDLADLLQTGEVITDFDILPDAGAIFAGLSIRQDGDYAPDQLDETTIRFWPQIDQTERQHRRFEGYGQRLGLIVSFTTNTNPARLTPQTFQLRVRR